MTSSRISVVGNVATRPELIKFPGGGSKCTFRYAVSERRLNKDTGAWEDGLTNWYRVNVYRALGEHAYTSLSKGDRVIVFGKLQLREWESGERSGTSIEIDAEAVGHDLRWGTTTFTKLVTGRPKNLDLANAVPGEDEACEDPWGNKTSLSRQEHSGGSTSGSRDLIKDSVNSAAA
jgi:single-strand DNA-binding protein